MHFINRCTWKSSQYYITMCMLTSFMRVSQRLVFHQNKCISAIKRKLSTTAMYVSSSSMYLRILCYCDACLNSNALRVGVKTLHNTIKLYISSLFLRQVPTFWAIGQYTARKIVYATPSTFWLKSCYLMVENSLAKLPIPKLSLHNSAAFCIRQKLRRDLPDNLTF